MNALDVLRSGFGGSHGILDQQMADCAPAAQQKQFAGSNVAPISSIYMHVFYSEDNLINGALRGQPALWQTAGYEGKTGLKLPPNSTQNAEWLNATNKIEVSALKDYAAAVRQQTDSYLASLSESDLDRKVSFFGQEMTAGTLLANVVLWHVCNHSGEIAALKGIQGLKGLPF